MKRNRDNMERDIHNNRHETVPFPAELTGYIIGGGGNGIRSLRERSGVSRAWVDEHATTQRGRQFSVMHFVGNSVNIDAAKLQLVMRITDAIQNGVLQPAQRDTANARGRDRDRSPGQA